MRRLLFAIVVLTFACAHNDHKKNDDTVQREEEILRKDIVDTDPEGKACNESEISGCVMLGEQEYNKGNVFEARLFFKQACDGGEMPGCFNLGHMEYEKGNLVKARQFFKQACDGRLMIACARLGFLEEKRGDIVEATLLYKKACDGGNNPACKALVKRAPSFK
jgi:hypothetical protein